MLFTVLVVAVVGIALAALSNEGDAESERGTDTIQLTLADNGSAVALSAGDTLIVELEGNPTTGYGWELDALDESILRPVGEPGYQSDSDLVGSPGTFTFAFDAAEPGDTVLRLVYLRPWEEVEPIQAFSVTVTVE
jgi:inhibitor of cysteine peptidase